MGQLLVNKAQFPEKFQPLFIPKRYKCYYGGRGGAKSRSFARALLLKASENPLRWLCAREFQKSIKDSVHRLLKDEIARLNLEAYFDVRETAIRGKAGTTAANSEFFFEGLRHNAANIKSYEGCDGAWVEEAHLVPKSSWEILIPTIRKDGSEIWVSFNPELADDDTYQRFVINPPPPDMALVVKVGWRDNPWFPEVLRQEMEELKRRDPDAYLNVWEGHPREILEGAIYANELRAAKEDGRICRVPYDTSKPVNTFWDLGWADNTSIWFAQSVGLEYRVVDFYQNSLQPLQHYLKVLQDRPYVYGRHILPHDARAKSLATGRSVQEMMEATLGISKVDIAPELSIADGINAARSVFSVCWFDEAKCADGLNSLRRYRYDVDPDTKKFSKTPLHDDASHAADAFRYMAVSITHDRPKKRQQSHEAAGSWMSL